MLILARQNVLVGNVTLKTDIVLNVQETYLGMTARTNVQPTVGRALMRLFARRANPVFMASAAKEAVRFVEEAVTVISPMEHVDIVFAKKIITDENVQKFVIQTVMDLAHLLADDVLENANLESSVRIATKIALIIALRV